MLRFVHLLPLLVFHNLPSQKINIPLSSFYLDVKKSGINAHYIDMLAQEACFASARILLAGTSACGGSQLWDKELASWSGHETVSRLSPFDY